LEVMSKIDSVIDLVAAEARYHHSCYKPFCRSTSCAPGSNREVEKVGRRNDEEKSTAFYDLCDYLRQNDECQYSMSELMEKLQELNPSAKSYCEQHLRNKLQSVFGNLMTVTYVPGKKTIVSFQTFV